MVELISKELTQGRNPLIEARQFVNAYEKFEGKSKLIARANGIINALLMELKRYENAEQPDAPTGEPEKPALNPPKPVVRVSSVKARPKQAEIEGESEGESETQSGLLAKREAELNKVIAMERGNSAKSVFDAGFWCGGLFVWTWTCA